MINIYVKIIKSNSLILFQNKTSTLITLLEKENKKILN